MGWDYIGSGDHGGGGWMVMMGDQTEKTGRMEEAEKWRCEERFLSAFRRRNSFRSSRSYLGPAISSTFL